MPFPIILQMQAQARINASVAKTHQAVLAEVLAHPDVETEMTKAAQANVPFAQVFMAIVQAILAGFSGGTFNLATLIPAIIAAIAALIGGGTPANSTLTMEKAA